MHCSSRIHVRHRFLWVYVRSTVCVCTDMDIMESSTALSYTVTRTTVAYSTVGSGIETETENEYTR